MTHHRETEARLRHLSTHDSLTELYNRAFLEAELTRLERGRFPVSVVIIDLDNLKETNDEFGHAAGDRLLKRTAAVLRTSFRAEDIIARFGGDEFAVLLPGVDEARLEQAIQRLELDLCRHNEVHRGVDLSFSIGGATARHRGSLHAALRVADHHMYQRKRAAREGDGSTA